MSRIATLLTADNLAIHGRKVWLYEWDYESNDVQNVINAAHMVDSVFSWGNLVYWTDNTFLGPGDDYETDCITKQISLSIINFARNGLNGICVIPMMCEIEMHLSLIEKCVQSIL